MRRTGNSWLEPTIGTVVCASVNSSDGPLVSGPARLAFDFGRAFALGFFFFAFLAVAIAISRDTKKPAGRRKVRGYYPGLPAKRAFPVRRRAAFEIRKNHVYPMRLPHCSDDAAPLPKYLTRPMFVANKKRAD